MTRLYNTIFCSIALAIIGMTPRLAVAEPEMEKVRDQHIHSVQLHAGMSYNSPPIIRLGADEQIHLTFDRLGVNSNPNYKYTIVHCDADWNVSNMLQSDYIQGIFSDFILGGYYSSSSYQQYTHYKMSFPNDQIKPKISGNYVLRVFTEDPNRPVIQKRFYVVQYGTNISGTVKRPTYTSLRDGGQEIDFQIALGELPVNDPRTEIKVHIKQNWRVDNEIRDLKPTYVQGKNLIYDYQDINVFKAGNEFRQLDCRNFQFKGQGIRTFMLTDSGYVANLLPITERNKEAYSNITDQNGAFVLQNRQGNDVTRDGDYCKVQFKFAPKDINNEDKDLYVYGGLTNWVLDPRFKLEWDKRTGTYNGESVLKQGFYDYMIVKDNDGVIEHSDIEGDHWETENTYYIFVYWRPYYLTGDLLIGYTLINSVSGR